MIVLYDRVKEWLGKVKLWMKQLLCRHADTPPRYGERKFEYPPGKIHLIAYVECAKCEKILQITAYMSGEESKLRELLEGEILQ